MDEEQWKPIAGFEFYEVSNHGRVRSLPRQGHRPVPGKILKPSPRRRRGGRLQKMIVNLGRGNGRSVHRLVLEAFVGPCPPGCEGCHDDGNPENNNLSNLRWDHHQSNMADQQRHGTKSNPPVHRGESHPLSKLTEADVRAIKAPPTRDGILPELSRRYGVSTKTIWRIRAGKVWAHV